MIASTREFDEKIMKIEDEIRKCRREREQKQKRKEEEKKREWEEYNKKEHYRKMDQITEIIHSSMDIGCRRVFMNSEMNTLADEVDKKIKKLTNES